MKQVLFILFGWILGLLGPWLADLIQRPSRKSETKKGIFVELRGLRAKLASVVLGVGTHIGELDAETIRWFRSTLRDDETIKELADPRFEQLANLDDQSIRDLSRAHAAPATQTLTFKRYSLPYLEAHLHELSLFSEEFQRLAHRIRSRLEVLNQDTEINWFYFQKTFDSSLSDLNRGIIAQNLNASKRGISRLARLLCDDIQALFEI